MTTGYTTYIEEKDEPLSTPTPSSFEPNPSYKEDYDIALKELEEAKKMTFDEVKIQMRANYKQRISEYKTYAERAIATNEKYTKVKKEVEEWVPPTEEHQGLKTFALKQIDMCITKQKDIDKYLEKSKEKFDDSDEAVLNYINDIIDHCQRNVERFYKSWQEELERTRSKNEWMARFLESLDNEPEKCYGRVI